MCGIAGFFRIADRENPRSSEETVLRQISTMRYRGPDSAGYFIGPGVALAHARLSIIDVSSAADQPMTDGSGDVVVAFNGEIYNFEDVRRELITKGHRFRTRSDTEVIVEGFLEWGVDVVHRLRGMFAIAIYDRRDDRLVLLRDRVGKKPLYYAVFDETLVFASEIKGILAYPEFARRVDLDAIHEYLTFQYVPSPMTAFQGVYKLPPAHVAIARRRDAIRINRYYALPRPSEVRTRPVEELREELVGQLKEATRLRMISDVPLGAFLSGGVDSSSVVAMMAEVSNAPVRTFTIGFEEAAYDERRYARMVAERYRTAHTELTVKADAMHVLPTLVYHYGEPYADSSAIPTYYVSKLAREHVTVILSGDGGDESFLGYPRYAACRRHDSIANRRFPLIRQLARLTRALPNSFDRFERVRRAKVFAEILQASRSRQYERYVAYFSDESKAELYAGEMRSFLHTSALDRLDAYFAAAETMTLGAAWADTHTYLPDDLLIKVDVASMANSLEVRAPFLDHKLMEWAAAIPEKQRFQNDEPKALLKQAMEPYLPHDLLYRPKMGFGVPIEQWLRTDLREFSRDLLLSDQFRNRGLFQNTYVRQLLDKHAAGENLSNRIWALMMLEMWFRMWVDEADILHAGLARSIIDRYRAPIRKVA